MSNEEKDSCQRCGDFIGLIRKELCAYCIAREERVPRNRKAIVKHRILGLPIYVRLAWYFVALFAGLSILYIAIFVICRQAGVALIFLVLLALPIAAFALLNLLMSSDEVTYRKPVNPVASFLKPFCGYLGILLWIYFKFGYQSLTPSLTLIRFDR